MKEALDINSFTANGQNYRASETVELSDVEKYLSGQGYETVSMDQPWRNVFARLKSSDGEGFFKLASTPGVGERLKNEIDWNTQLIEAMERSERASFRIPKILGSGIWNDRPYYIGEYFPGPFVQEKASGDCGGLKAWLPKIVDCNLFLLSLDTEGFSFYRDREFHDIREYTDSLVKRVESWIAQVPERDLSGLRSEMAKLRDGFVPGVNHGDFVPWHMIVNGEGFVLIDGEHGSSKTVRYYDIAYFFHRVYTVLENPGLAKEYLSIVCSKLNGKEKDLFDSQFPSVLASRIIGGYFDAKHDGADFSIHDRLHEEFLDGSIIQRH